MELHEGDGADGVHGVDVEGLRTSAINLKVESFVRKHEAPLIHSAPEGIKLLLCILTSSSAPEIKHALVNQNK